MAKNPDFLQKHGINIAILPNHAENVINFAENALLFKNRNCYTLVINNVESLRTGRFGK
jgi:hypothetical protein